MYLVPWASETAVWEISLDKTRPRDEKYIYIYRGRERERERERVAAFCAILRRWSTAGHGVPTSAIKMVACKVMQRKEKWPNCSPLSLQNSFRHYRPPSALFRVSMLSGIARVDGGWIPIFFNLYHIDAWIKLNIISRNILIFVSLKIVLTKDQTKDRDKNFVEDEEMKFRLVIVNTMIRIMNEWNIMTS